MSIETVGVGGSCEGGSMVENSAHTHHALDYVELGISIARKGWLEKSDVLNCGSVADVLAHARRHRA